MSFSSTVQEDHILKTVSGKDNCAAERGILKDCVNIESTVRDRMSTEDPDDLLPAPTRGAAYAIDWDNLDAVNPFKSVGAKLRQSPPPVRGSPAHVESAPTNHSDTDVLNDANGVEWPLEPSELGQNESEDGQLNEACVDEEALGEQGAKRRPESEQNGDKHGYHDEYMQNEETSAFDEEDLVYQMDERDAMSDAEAEELALRNGAEEVTQFGQDSITPAWRPPPMSSSCTTTSARSEELSSNESPAPAIHVDIDVSHLNDLFTNRLELKGEDPSTPGKEDVESNCESSPPVVDRNEETESSEQPRVRRNGPESAIEDAAESTKEEDMNDTEQKLKDLQAMYNEHFNIDPAAWDLLMRCSGDAGEGPPADVRDSLLIQFDPLFENQNLPPAVLRRLTEIGAFQLRSPASKQRTERLQTAESAPIMNREDLLVLLTPTPKKPNQADKENSEREIDHVRKELHECQERLKQSESEHQKAVAAIQQDNQELRNQNSQLLKERRKDDQLLKQYVNTLDTVLAEKCRADLRLEELEREHAQLQQDLQSLDNSFADLFRRYENLKQKFVDAQKNGEELQTCLSDRDQALLRHDEKYRTLKKHAEERLQEVENKLRDEREAKSGELLRLNAALKKAELRVQALEQEVAQKKNENIELTKICDELLSNREKRK